MGEKTLNIAFIVGSRKFGLKWRIADLSLEIRIRAIDGRAADNSGRICCTCACPGKPATTQCNTYRNRLVWLWRGGEKGSLIHPLLLTHTEFSTAWMIINDLKFVKICCARKYKFHVIHEHGNWRGYLVNFCVKLSFYWFIDLIIFFALIYPDCQVRIIESLLFYLIFLLVRQKWCFPLKRVKYEILRTMECGSSKFLTSN